MHHGEVLLTGYILSIAFNGGPTRQLVSIGGYSIPGVLEDCDIPIAIDGMGLDNIGKSLTEIALRYLEPFGIGLVIDGVTVRRPGANITAQNTTGQTPVSLYNPAINSSDGAIPISELLNNNNNIGGEQFTETLKAYLSANNAPDGTKDKYGIVNTPWGEDDETVTEKMDEQINSASAQVGQNIKTYLAKLASYKNIILSHDEFGNLVFTKSKKNQESVATFNQGVPETSMSLSFNGQGMHSHIIAVQQPDATGQASAFDPVSLRNPFVPYVFRPKVVKVDIPKGNDDGNSHALQTAKNVLCNELRNLKLIITTSQWNFPNSKHTIRPNRVITVVNEEIFLYKASKWFIESVELDGDEKKEVAKITCCLPSCYDYTEPVYIFQGETQH